MEPANKPPVKRPAKDQTEIEFLPDADAIERGPLPRFVRLTLYVLLAAFVTFIIYASLSTVEKIVVAKGRLVSPEGNIVLQPLETSIIQKINVQVGQVVKKGQLLATLDPTFTAADEAQLRTRLQSLDTQTASLRAELDGRKAPGATAARGDADTVLQSQLAGERQANYEAQKRKMDENIARLQAGLETNKRDQSILAQRVKSLREVEAMQEQLMAEQFGAKMHLLEARDRRLEVERDMILQHNKQQEMERELASAVAERAAFSNSWRQKTMEDLLAASRDRDGINEQLAKADKRHQMVQMVAPADGVVLEIAKLSAGSIAREAEPLITLVPLSANLEAEVQIDSLDIGYIKVGDKVHVKIDTFNFQQHGMLEGQVRTLSQDAFRRDPNAQAQQGQDAYYIAHVNYGNSKLKKLAPGVHLLPGMTLSAEIVVGKRTVMSYLLWPLTKAVNESIREP